MSFEKFANTVVSVVYEVVRRFRRSLLSYDTEKGRCGVSDWYHHILSGSNHQLMFYLLRYWLCVERLLQKKSLWQSFVSSIRTGKWSSTRASTRRNRAFPKRYSPWLLQPLGRTRMYNPGWLASRTGYFLFFGCNAPILDLLRRNLRTSIFLPSIWDE